ncbi:prepilin-type N-terminal cleavage/methylation domain-containing protein [Peptoniphilus sp.]|jgi:type IV pilus assembly protein PilA|uniref:prepilin-type N-terminal cleavage/methylation domain-containing protein n=1 Tax=Peptoniphilus sp. TaxID=1971214 RepID=UPI003D8E3A71
MKKFSKKNKGFTLLELVIVIAIIAILISVATMKYSNANLSAQAVAHNSNVKVLKNAGILFLVDNPEHTGPITEENLKPYLDGGKMPKPAKALKVKSDSFSVKAENGDIVVTPGTVKVAGNELVKDE